MTTSCRLEGTIGDAVRPRRKQLFGGTEARELAERIGDAKQHRGTGVFLQTNEKFRGSCAGFRSAAPQPDRSPRRLHSVNVIARTRGNFGPRLRGSLQWTAGKPIVRPVVAIECHSDRPARNRRRVSASGYGNRLGIRHAGNAQNGTSTRLGSNARVSPQAGLITAPPLTIIWYREPDGYPTGC